MAEIIVEPTALSKVIALKFKINDVDVPKTTQLSTNKQFNTTDTDAWFTFELDGLASTSGTYDLTLINLDDESIFNHADVIFPALPFHYKLNSSEDVTLNEIRHAGRWLGQLVVTMANGDTTARQFGFDIAGHILDGQDAQVILLSDYQALINTINLAKDDLAQYNVDYAALLVDIAAAEDARVTAYNQLLADQQANIEAFDVALDEGIVAANLATKLQDFEATNNSRLLSAEQQLADITHTVVYNLLFEGFLFDGSDESLKLQTLLDQHLGESITLVLPQNKSLNISNVRYTGTLNVVGNWCTVTGSGFIFLNKTNQSIRLYVENIKVVGDVGICDFDVDAGAVGTKINLKNIVASGINRSATFVKCKSTDFLNFENVELYNYNVFLDAQSDVISGERTNTQLHLKNINVMNTKFGMILNGVDKITAIGMDVSGCSTGIVIKSHVTRGLFTNYHCEYFGTYVTGAAYDGCGIFIQGRANQNIKFQESSIMLPGANSSHGIYMSNSTYADNFINQLIFEDCYVPYDVSLQPNYKAINLCEGFEWYGEFPYTNLSAKLNNSPYNKVLLGVVKPALSNHSSRNLLNKSVLLQVSDFAVTEGSGTATVATVNGETVFTNTSGNDVGYSLTFNPPSAGWYTLIFNGNTGSNNLYIAQLTDPYKTFYQSVCAKKGDFQTNRVIFYVDDLSTLIKVKFDILNNSVVTLSEIGLFKGLKETY